MGPASSCRDSWSRLFFPSHRTRECFGFKGTLELVQSHSCHAVQLIWNLSSKLVSPWLLMGKRVLEPWGNQGFTHPS